MQDEFQRLKVALRVLGAVTEYREPEEIDIQELRSYAPGVNRQSPDELACDVIQQVLQTRGRSSDGVAERSEAALRDTWFGPEKHEDEYGGNDADDARSQAGFEL